MLRMPYRCVSALIFGGGGGGGVEGGVSGGTLPGSLVLSDYNRPGHMRTADVELMGLGSKLG